jgi:hypothetical protein
MDRVPALGDDSPRCEARRFRREESVPKGTEAWLERKAVRASAAVATDSHRPKARKKAGRDETTGQEPWVQAPGQLAFYFGDSGPKWVDFRAAMA